MSKCFEDFYDYELVKKRCRGGIVSLKCSFYKKKLKETVMHLTV